MSEDNSYHHLYYSAHADPVQELEKLNKSCLKLNSKTQNGSHAFAENRLEIMPVGSTRVTLSFTGKLHFHCKLVNKLVYEKIKSEGPQMLAQFLYNT